MSISLDASTFVFLDVVNVIISPLEQVLLFTVIQSGIFLIAYVSASVRTA